MIRLAVRFAISRSGQLRARSLLLLAGSFTSCLVLLMGVTVPYALVAQNDRAAALEPKFATDSGPVKSGLLALEPELMNSRDWAGNSVTRTAVSESGAGRAPEIPGVVAPPRAGEMYVSPELKSRLGHDQVLTALFSGYRVAGTIGDSGLTKPSELRAVIGVDPQTEGLQPVEAFGDDGTSGGPSHRGVDVSVVALISILVGAPLIAVIVVCAKAGDRQRATRVQSLRQVGLSARAVQHLLTLEGLLLVVPGFALAWLVYVAMARLGHGLPIGSFSYFTSDFGLPLALAAPLTLVLLGLFLFPLVHDVENGNESVVRTHDRSSRPFKLAVVAGGGAVAFLLMARFSPTLLPLPVTIWVGFGLLCFSTVTLSTSVCRWVATLGSKLAKRGGTFVGLRLIAADPGIAAGVARGVAALFILLTISAGYLSALGGGSPQANESPPPNGVLAYTSDYGRTLSAQDVSTANNDRVTIGQSELAGNSDTIRAVVTTCKELEELAGLEPSTCDDSKMAWLQSDAAVSGLGEPLTSSKYVTSGTKRLNLPDTRTGTLPLPRSASILDGLLFVPNTLARPDGTVHNFFTSVRTNRIERYVASVSGLAPSSSTDFGTFSSLDRDGREYRDQIGWLLNGAAASLALATISLIASAAGDSSARRQRVDGLHRLGATTSELIRCHIAFMFLPVLTTLGLGVAAAFGASVILRQFDERTATSDQLVTVLAVAAVAISAIVTISTMSNTLKRDIRQ